MVSFPKFETFPPPMRLFLKYFYSMPRRNAPASRAASFNSGDPALRNAIEEITENVCKAIDLKLGPLWQMLQIHDERLDRHESRISESGSSAIQEPEEHKPRDLYPQPCDTTEQDDEDPENGAVMKSIRVVQLPEDYDCVQGRDCSETLVFRVTKVEPPEVEEQVDSQMAQITVPTFDSDSNSVNTADQLHTCNWIRSHLEEHVDTCLPKQDVYETYRKHCENLQQRPLSAANFGKIIRDIFPNIKARRLGGRGQSKYCYSGIRRKTVLNMPLLPNLDLKNDPSELTDLVQTYKQEVTEAACELICDWAQKILKRSFDTVVEIARFLVQEHIVNPRCSQAELVTSATLTGGPSKLHKPMKKVQTTGRGTTSEEEGGAQDPKRAPDGMEQGSSVKPAADKSKGAELLRPGGREQQVEALMKKLPQLLPRGSVPDKSHLTVHTAAPPFPSNDSSAVKMALPITVTTLSPQQRGGASLPFMILPPAVTVSTTTTVTKRPSDSSTVAVTPPKRKRGRPRKPRPEETLPPNPSPSPNQSPNPAVLNRSVIQKALPSSSMPVKPEPEPQPILLLQEPGRAMVIQRAPLSRENRASDPPPTELPGSALTLPPPTVHTDRDEVEITLTPLDPDGHNTEKNPTAVTP